MDNDRLDRAHRHLVARLAARQLAPVAARPVVVGLLGRGIQASRTPRMHELEGRRLGLPYTYELIDFDALGLADADLADILRLTQSLGFAGLNVTFPFKQAILPLLDEVAPEAGAIGAVNTVVLGGPRCVGHNTDAWGFAESFRENLGGADLAHVVQFGAGGAGAAVSHALLGLGVGRLTLCETDPIKATALAARLSARFGQIVDIASQPDQAVPGATGIVNTTPVGMEKFPGLPFDGNRLDPVQWVADIVYFPRETALLARARALGCRVLPGTGMAVYQAVKAFEFFTGIAPDRAAMTAHFEAAA